MVLNPIGSFIQRFDTVLTASVDGLIGAMVTYAATPIALCAVLYYIMQGFRLAQGDAEVMHGFWGRLIKIGILIWLATNLDAFNYWIKGVVFLGIPTALIAALGPAMGVTPGTVTSTAAMFDNVWAQLWIIIGMAWTQMGFSVTGVLVGVVGALTAIFGGGGLLFISMVYIGARIVSAVLVVLTPAILICGIFDATKGVFERAIGKAISLTLLQVAGFVVMEIILLGNQWFMARATEAIISASTNGAVFAEAIQILLSICVWFLAGAYGMWEVRAVAYSLGTGNLSGMANAIAFAMMMRGRGGNESGGGGNGGGGGGGGGGSSLSMGFNRPPLPSPTQPAIGGGQAALPPPSQRALPAPAQPLAITHSTRS